MYAPAWLDKEAKNFWHKHYRRLSLSPEHAEGFAVLCQTYAQYRQAEDSVSRAKYLDFFLKMAKLYGLVPKPGAIQNNSDQTDGDFDAFLKTS